MEYAAPEENARNQHKGLWEDSRLLPLWATRHGHCQWGWFLVGDCLGIVLEKEMFNRSVERTLSGSAR
jgi:hypothetical protein